MCSLWLALFVGAPVTTSLLFVAAFDMPDKPFRAELLVEFSDPAACGCQSWDDFDPELIKTVHHPACQFFDDEELRPEEVDYA